MRLTVQVIQSFLETIGMRTLGFRQSLKPIGNFVEAKNARLGAGSKANHLTYLGDAEIGSGVNVGAGTITCNYDGANKHPTIIEDGVFIGSNTALVAPVTIERGATIGAGSTISKDAPAEALTVSRARQTTVKGWKRPRKDKDKKCKKKSSASSKNPKKKSKS